jgi:hypothetical protein
VRKASKGEQEEFGIVGAAYAGGAVCYEWLFACVERGSPGVVSRSGDSRTGATAARPSVEDTRRLASEPSSSDTTDSPPPCFYQPPSKSAGGLLLSDDSANAEGSEDAWAELKGMFLLCFAVMIIL